MVEAKHKSDLEIFVVRILQKSDHMITVPYCIKVMPISAECFVTTHLWTHSANFFVNIYFKMYMNTIFS